MPDPNADEAQRMRDAINALPELTRAVYLAHLVEDLDYREIGVRKYLTVREVERHIAQAIKLIDRFLRGGEDE